MTPFHFDLWADLTSPEPHSPLGAVGGVVHYAS